MVVYTYSVKMFFVEEQGRLCYAEDWVAEGGNLSGTLENQKSSLEFGLFNVLMFSSAVHIKRQ